VDEGEAEGRPDRRESERRGQDDRLGVLGAAEGGSPVSTPLRWEEVDESLDPAAFTMDVVRKRVEEHGDLFADVLKSKQSLSAALRALQ
jgi:hypothetical protein